LTLALPILTPTLVVVSLVAAARADTARWL
jgi:hypothetical protein